MTLRSDVDSLDRIRWRFRDLGSGRTDKEPFVLSLSRTTDD
jgi:hypothetical protein